MAALNIQAAMSGTAGGGTPPVDPPTDRGDYSGKSLVLDGANDFLNRTFGTPANQGKFSFSAWVKKCTVGGTVDVFSATGHEIQFDADLIRFGVSGSYTIAEGVFRDTHTHFHLLCTFDSTAAALLRAKIYINGVEVSYSSQGFQSNVSFNSAVAHKIGSGSNTRFWNGYVSKVDFIDGLALDPTSFGQFSATTGKFVIKDTSTLSFGANGFSLDFDNTRGVDPDTITTIFDQSGNSNDWTGNSLLNPESFTRDTPVDNFATMNVLFTKAGTTLSNGNKRASLPVTSNLQATVAMRSPDILFYYEMAYISTTGSAGGANNCIVTPDIRPTENALAVASNRWAYHGSGSRFIEGVSSAYGNAYTVGARLAVAVYKNAIWYGQISNNVITWQNGATAVEIEAGNVANAMVSGLPDILMPAMGNSSGSFSYVWECAFGEQDWEGVTNRPTIATQLSSANLPQPANFFPQNNANVVLYDGTAAEKDVLGMNFSPDFVWSKNRDATASHNVQDAVRGEGKNIQTDSVAQESISDISGVLSFVTPIASDDGFRLGTSTEWNTANNRYWSLGIKANGAGVANTSGDIPSIVSTDGTGNFSIVTYTGTGTAGTIGHGLGVVPDMVIVKKRTGSSDWQVYHSANTGTLGTAQPKTQALILNKNVSSQTASTVWNNTKPDANVFTVGTAGAINVSPQEYVAYCFVFGDVFDGGSYIGNGSTDGSFVPGDEMLMLMLKRTDTLKNWYIYDQVRDPFNPSGSGFFPDSPNPEFNAASLDFLSNGIKLRTGDGSLNVGRFIWFGLKLTGGSLSA